MLHPIAGEPGSEAIADLVVIVPVRDRPAPLARCVEALQASGVLRVIVVDDGSLDVEAHRSVAADAGAQFVARLRSGGPAAARSTGLAEAPASTLVAFVDSDIEVDPGWLDPLVGLFVDPSVALAAPRVRHLGSTPVHDRPESVLDRYETANSPLDLGDRPALIAAGRRVSYVPAAALVVRRAAFDAVGGFDDSLTVGEDVDLVWRLHDAGWRCRYEPASTVRHHGRSRLVPLLRRRFDYGRSAAELDRRHPGALPPLRGNSWSAGVVGAALVGRPLVAAGVGAWTAGALARKLDPLDDARRVAARLTFAGHLGFARQLARAAVRPWLPFALAAALVSRRARRLLALGALVAPITAWRDRRPPLDPVRWIACWLADDVAYTAGVWIGCIRRRSFGALRPEIAVRSGAGVRPAGPQN